MKGCKTFRKGVNVIFSIVYLTNKYLFPLKSICAGHYIGFNERGPLWAPPIAHFMLGTPYLIGLMNVIKLNLNFSWISWVELGLLDFGEG